MARGWESKSVEAQIDLAEDRNFRAIPVKIQDHSHVETLRKKETVMLSRTRVVRELAAAQNPRYKAQLNKALEELETQLAAFAVGA